MTKEQYEKIENSLADLIVSSAEYAKQNKDASIAVTIPALVGSLIQLFVVKP